MVGPLASLVRWQAARGHDVTALAWYLVRWQRWSVGIVGRLPEVMTSHTLASGTWSVGIVVPLASLAGCQIGHDVTIEVTL